MRSMRVLAGMGVCICALCAVLDGGPAELAHRVSGASAQQQTLVLDAGHGGFDGGAVGAGGTSEQDINLCITRRVRDLAGLFGVPCVLTRDSAQALDYQPDRTVRENKVADIRAREAICRAVPDPVFVSIHLNKFEQPQYFGAQVFYSPHHPLSRTLAEQLQAAFLQGVPNGNTRRARPAAGTIYLMQHLTCPAVVVECGFLSNPQEEIALGQPEYQTQLAVCIVAGCLRGRGGAAGAVGGPI